MCSQARPRSGARSRRRARQRHGDGVAVSVGAGVVDRPEREDQTTRRRVRPVQPDARRFCRRRCRSTMPMPPTVSMTAASAPQRFQERLLRSRQTSPTMSAWRAGSSRWWRHTRRREHQEPRGRCDGHVERRQPARRRFADGTGAYQFTGLSEGSYVPCAERIQLPAGRATTLGNVSGVNFSATPVQASTSLRPASGNVIVFDDFNGRHPPENGLDDHPAGTASTSGRK
jgi:hypothetical protein